MSEVKKFSELKKLFQHLKIDAESSLLTEMCGLISFKDNFFIYKKMKNISSEGNFFKINPSDYLNFINEFGCFCIFHSHICGDENPSETDKLNSKNCCKSFLIYSVITEKFNLYEPENKDYDVNIVELIKELL